MRITYYVSMRSRQNITLAIDAKLVEKSRIIAIKRRTSLTKLIRQFLQELVRKDDESVVSKNRIKELLTSPPLHVGNAKWNREDLHER